MASLLIPPVNFQLKLFDIHPAVFLIVCPIILVLTVFATALRLYVRVWMMKSVRIDDYLLIVALGLLIAVCGEYMAYAHIERTQGVLGPAGKLSQLILSGVLTYTACQIFLKISLAIFLVRIVDRKWQRVVMLTSLVLFVVCALLVFFVSLFTHGVPTRANLLKEPVLSTTTVAVANYIAASSNIIIDWILTFTPIPVVVKAQMPRRAKVSVIALILLAALGSVGSIARLPFIKEVYAKSSPHFFGRIVPLALITLAEASAGIIAVSLASIRPLLNRLSEANARRRANGGSWVPRSQRFKWGTHGLHHRGLSGSSGTGPVAGEESRGKDDDAVPLGDVESGLRKERDVKGGPGPSETEMSEDEGLSPTHDNLKA